MARKIKITPAVIRSEQEILDRINHNPNERIRRHDFQKRMESLRDWGYQPVFEDGRLIDLVVL